MATSNQAGPLRDRDAIVAHIEVNHRHGVGVLVGRIFGECADVVSIRSQDFYGGAQQFGASHVCITHGPCSRDAAERRVSDALGGSRIARIVCIPYFPDDVVNAIVLHDIFNAPLCTYLMDDQNILCDGIPDALMSELLEKSTLRLAISPEMCQAYEHKFGHRFWLVPPLAPRQFIPHEVNYAGSVRPNQGIIIGNIWGKRWTELLCETVRGSGVTLDWYSSRGDVAAFTDEELARDGIVVHERRADAELTPILRRYAFAVVPSGTLDEADDRRFIAQLSLPSRITYTMATSHTPMLVLGSPDTVAARFVTRTGIGLSAPYDPRGFQGVVDRITEPETNRRMREAAFRLAPKYSDQGAAQWIWDSLARGGPVDDRYQERGS